MSGPWICRCAIDRRAAWSGGGSRRRGCGRRCVDAYYGHASKAALTEAAGMNCADLALCWRDLWARLDGLDEVAVRHEIESLKRRLCLRLAPVRAK